MSVNRPQIGKSHLFKKRVGQDKSLDTVFKAFQPLGKKSAQRARVQRLYHKTLYSVIAPAGAKHAQVPAHCSHIGRNGHFIIIQNHYQRQFAVSGIVQRFIGQPPCKRPIPDESGGAARFSVKSHAPEHSQGGGNGGTGMTGIEAVVNTFLPLGEAGDPSSLTQGCTQSLPAACKNLMGIGLMPHVKDQLIPGAPIDPVHGYDELHGPQAGGQMPAGFGNGLHHELPQLKAKPVQFFFRQGPQVFYGLDMRQDTIDHFSLFTMAQVNSRK